jgi:hypothetical protein
MNRSETIGKLALALSKVQGKLHRLEPAHTAKVATKKGGEYGYNYADLSDGWDLLRPLLSENEIAVMQPTRVDGQRILVETALVHSSGEWASGEIAVPISEDMRGAQAIGSAVTFARRYGLWAMVGVSVAEEDDDGAKASPAPRRRDAGESLAAEDLLSSLDMCLSVDELEKWRAQVRDKVNALPDELATAIIGQYKARLVTVRGKA